MLDIRGVICDMDGTLVDSEPYHLEAWNRMLELYGHVPPSPHWNDDCIGLPDSYAIDKTILLFPDMAKHGDLLETKQQIFRELVRENGGTLAYHGVERALEQLRDARVGLGVGTNSVLANARATLEAAGLWDLLPVVVTADMVKHTKPAPDIYLAAAKGLELAPGNCLVLEDSVAGLEAARAAGCIVAGITNTWTPDKLVPSDMIFTSTASALDWVLEQTTENRLSPA